MRSTREIEEDTVALQNRVKLLKQEHARTTAKVEVIGKRLLDVCQAKNRHAESLRKRQALRELKEQSVNKAKSFVSGLRSNSVLKPAPCLLQPPIDKVTTYKDQKEQDRNCLDLRAEASFQVKLKTAELKKRLLYERDQRMLQKERILAERQERAKEIKQARNLAEQEKQVKLKERVAELLKEEKEWLEKLSEKREQERQAMLRFEMVLTDECGSPVGTRSISSDSLDSTGLRYVTADGETLIIDEDEIFGIAEFLNR